MKKFLFYFALVIVVLGGLLRYSLEFEGPQDTAMRQLARVAMNQAAEGLPNPDSLRVFVCGSASPLGQSDQAQACIAILTPKHFYIVDSGAGSTANVTGAGLPTNRLQGVFLTHFHSDHIAELYELNLNSWVRGRPEPLRVYGPRGVRRVVGGVNDTYELDRGYRVTHHGEDLLRPDLGILDHKTVKAGVVLEDGDLKVTAYVGEHDPASPAFGYRFDYRGRSVIVSGDSNVTDETRRIVAGADLLLHDALSVPVVTTMADTAAEAGLNRMSRIATDVLDYHASTDSLIDLADDVSIDMVAFYHLVPVPANLLVEQIFSRNLPENFVITRDGDWFELPASTNEIIRH